jgi:hypothetical protein
MNHGQLPHLGEEVSCVYEPADIQDYTLNTRPHMNPG